MKQHTIAHWDTKQLDEAVQEFESTHAVRATQSYCVPAHTDQRPVHVRVLFFEEERASSILWHLGLLKANKEKLTAGQVVELRDLMESEIERRKAAHATPDSR